MGQPWMSLFVQVLGVLSHEGLINALERVMHDGGEVEACASDKSFRAAKRPWSDIWIGPGSR